MLLSNVITAYMSLCLCVFLLQNGECQEACTMMHFSVLLRQATLIRSFSILGHLLLHVLHEEVNDLHTGCEEVLLDHDTPIKGESHGPAVGNLSIHEAARTARS